MSDKKSSDPFHVSSLLARKLYGTLTAPEEAELEAWLNESADNRAVLEKLLSESIRKQEIEHLHEFDEETALKKVWARIGEPENTGSNTLKGYIIKIAAAAAIVIALSVSFWIYKAKSPTERLSYQAKSTEIPPGANKAILILSNGAKIDLQAAQSGKIAYQAGAVVSKRADGKIDYAATAKPGTAAALNTLSVPKGGQYELTLPDGTLVWLNAASSLTFPVAFTGKERQVKLTGEAYFEVAKDPGKPFLVNVDGKQTVEVLGTHFDIKAYNDDPEIRTTLLEGSVKVSCKNSHAIIKPGQMAVNDLKAPLSVRNADLDEVMGWKNGLFVFNDERMEDVLRIAARWYDVDVEYQTDVSQKKLRGIVSKYNNIRELLDNITITSGIHYKIEGRRVILMN
ncbi:FecR family protein [Chitinophaga rupis]|uniref:FecR family protein n=1 Tax=Chitinophaga rupis TaxID=573321 RepID=A0A1H7UTA3_9BACT|nr:FecR family protein [Chitinophaga rupis]SEL99989.1 FecR family protein [Chitinophaga rupis]